MNMRNMGNIRPDACSGRMLNIMRTDSLPLGESPTHVMFMFFFLVMILKRKSDACSRYP
jgi:hypothetical protein